MRGSKFLAHSRVNKARRDSRPGRIEYRALSKDVDELCLFGFVYSEAFEDTDIAPVNVAKALKQCKGETLRVRVNSPGGDADAGIAIYNLLKSSNKKVEICIDGRAASAASVISMAGDVVYMGVGSHIMIHRASCVNAGNADQLRELANELEQLDNALVDIYLTRCSLSADEIKEAMAAETTYSREQAMKLKFADAKLEEIQNVEDPESEDEEMESEDEEMESEDEEDPEAEDEEDPEAEDEEMESEDGEDPEAEDEEIAKAAKAAAKQALAEMDRNNKRNALLQRYASVIPPKVMKGLRDKPYAFVKSFCATLKESGVRPLAGKSGKAKQPPVPRASDDIKLSRSQNKMLAQMGVNVDEGFKARHAKVVAGEFDLINRMKKRESA